MHRSLSLGDADRTYENPLSHPLGTPSAPHVSKRFALPTTSVHSDASTAASPMPMPMPSFAPRSMPLPQHQTAAPAPMAMFQSSPNIASDQPNIIDQSQLEQLQQQQQQLQQQQQQQQQSQVIQVVNVGALPKNAMFYPVLFSLSCHQQPGIESIPITCTTGVGGTIVSQYQNTGNTHELPHLNSPWTNWKMFTIGTCPRVGESRSVTALTTIAPGSVATMDAFSAQNGGFYIIFPTNELRDSSSFRILCSEKLDEQQTTLLGQFQDYARVEKKEGARASYYRIVFRQPLSQIAYCSSGYTVRFKGRSIPNSGVLSKILRSEIVELEQTIDAPHIGFAFISLA